MISKPPPAIHFPSAKDKGAFPFPTSQSVARQQRFAAEPPEAQADEQLSAEDLRLMADTMPGEGPGD
jgi:hypothetical protein